MDRKRASVAAEELVVWAPLLRPPILVPRRRPPAVARQRAWGVAGVQMVVRAPSPRPPVL